jgi:hypothetical protein
MNGISRQHAVSVPLAMKGKRKKLNTFLSVAELTALHQQSRLFNWGHIKFSLWK